MKIKRNHTGYILEELTSLGLAYFICTTKTFVSERSDEKLVATKQVKCILNGKTLYRAKMSDLSLKNFLSITSNMKNKINNFFSFTRYVKTNFEDSCFPQKLYCMSVTLYKNDPRVFLTAWNGDDISYIKTISCSSYEEKLKAFKKLKTEMCQIKEPLTEETLIRHNIKLS